MLYYYLLSDANPRISRTKFFKKNEKSCQFYHRGMLRKVEHSRRPLESIDGNVTIHFQIIFSSLPVIRYHRYFIVYVYPTTFRILTSISSAVSDSTYLISTKSKRGRLPRLFPRPPKKGNGKKHTKKISSVWVFTPKVTRECFASVRTSRIIK